MIELRFLMGLMLFSLWLSGCTNESNPGRETIPGAPLEKTSNQIPHSDTSQFLAEFPEYAISSQKEFRSVPAPGIYATPPSSKSSPTLFETHSANRNEVIQYLINAIRDAGPEEKFQVQQDFPDSLTLAHYNWFDSVDMEKREPIMLYFPLKKCEISVLGYFREEHGQKIVLWNELGEGPFAFGRAIWLARYDSLFQLLDYVKIHQDTSRYMGFRKVKSAHFSNLDTLQVRSIVDRSKDFETPEWKFRSSYELRLVWEDESLAYRFDTLSILRDTL